MKKRRYLTYFLFCISMIMLMIPVIPHHHHANGLMCLKNDISADCCEHSRLPVADHCCNDTGCVTTHFFQQAPHADDTWAQPVIPWVATLFPEFPRSLTNLLHSNGHRLPSCYIESLHSTFISRATGLRAPPCVLV